MGSVCGGGEAAAARPLPFPHARPQVSPSERFDVIIGSDVLLGAYKSVQLLPGGRRGRTLFSRDEQPATVASPAGRPPSRTLPRRAPHPGVISRHLAPGGAAALLNAVRSRERLSALLAGLAAAGLEAAWRELSRAEVDAGFACGRGVDGPATAATYEGGFVLIEVRRRGGAG